MSRCGWPRENGSIRPLCSFSFCPQLCWGLGISEEETTLLTASGLLACSQAALLQGQVPRVSPYPAPHGRALLCCLLPTLPSLLHEPPKPAAAYIPQPGGTAYHPPEGPRLGKGPPLPALQGGCLRCPAPGQGLRWPGRQCGRSSMSRGVAGEGLVWAGIADLCPLAPLQHRAPQPRTPCSRPTPECSSMQVVSIHASPRWSPWWSPAACTSPCLGIAPPKPGLSSVGGLGEWGGTDRDLWSPYQAASFSADVLW